MPNDDLDGRLPLSLGLVVESRTDGCTVQWRCVDEKLTGKCIDYHNDQWFGFRPPRAGRYYVNIGQQRCRDVRGVQLVALTAGEPCKPATYQILSCTSLGTQDDIFVPLDAPEAGHEILLCVDGYLHDYCRFALTVDSVARGIPAVAVPMFDLQQATASRVVPLHWTLPDSLTTEATTFVVRRREAAEPRATDLALVAVERNAAGGTVLTYERSDTLAAPGQYVYQVVAEGGRQPVLLTQQTVVYRDRAPAAATAYADLPIDEYPTGAELTILVADAATGRILRRAQLRKQKNAPRQGRLLVEEWRRAGVPALRVTITHEPGRGRPPQSREVHLPL